MGLARVNQSIEAFIYCVLAAQVNTQNSIVGTDGKVQKAQTEFFYVVGRRASRAKSGKKHRKVPACYPRSKDESQPRSVPWGVADAVANDNQHDEPRGLQQQPPAGNTGERKGRKGMEER